VQSQFPGGQLAGIRFGSINTGLPPNIVDQLIEAERIPVKQLEARKMKSEEKMKLVEDLQTKVGDIRKNLGELANTRGFTDVKLTSGDPSVISGTVDPASYTPGNWNVEVMQLAQKASVKTNGFPDKDKTEIGIGYFRFQTPRRKTKTFISTIITTPLKGAAKSHQPSRHRRASKRDQTIEKTRDNPWKLVLSSDGSRHRQVCRIPATLFFSTVIRTCTSTVRSRPKTESFKVDGFEMEIGDKRFERCHFQGVTLELKASIARGRAVNLTVKRRFGSLSVARSKALSMH
jgi:flagellar hook-associated protein 2